MPYCKIIETFGSEGPPSRLCCLVARLMNQQHACVIQGWICSDNCMCCHIEVEVSDQTFSLTLLQYTDTRPASPSAGVIKPGAWKGIHRNIDFYVSGMT